MEKTKKTEMECFFELKELVSAFANEDQKEYLASFIDKKLDSLEKRRVAAKERADKKKAESDALTEQIASIMTDEIQTVEDIVSTLTSNGEEEVTPNKVTSRLTKLINAGAVVKETIRVNGNRKMAYRKANENDEVVAAEA